jgi:capsular polysaccharide export protein
MISGRASAHRADAHEPLPENLLVLFPERASSLRHKRGRDHRPVIQTELQTPPFRHGAPWVSARVGAWLEPALRDATSQDDARGAALLAQLAKARVGGTFWAPAPGLSGHADILLCLPDTAAAASRMLHAALACYDAARLLVLAPTAVLAAEPQRLGCLALIAPCDPWPLLDRVGEIHIGGDTPLALLALAAGKRLVCHAVSAWSGWGVTHDESGIARRGTRSAGTLAAAALISAARHADPFRGRTCSAEEAIDTLAEWRRLSEATRGIGCVFGIAWWKRREVMTLLNAGRPLPLDNIAKSAIDTAQACDGAVLAWSSLITPELAEQAGGARVPVWQVEDGFVRSVGLGANSTPPFSLVVDRRGIYFDPSRPSDLEHLLQHAEFPPVLLARAAALRDALIHQRISKYNTGNSLAHPRRAAPGQRVVLVPGQVSDDRSVVLGGGAIRDNLDLLAQVRRDAPDAWIIYKPHPDVAAGQRAGLVRNEDAQRYADEIVRDISMPALLDQVDEVHVLTSLTGFEALLRGRRVVAYGQPFYAGWGLTEDKLALPRRQRVLSLDQLVAGTLLLYPHYLDPVSRLPCMAEVLLERLDDPSLWTSGPRIRIRQAYGRLRRTLGLR